MAKRGHLETVDESAPSAPALLTDRPPYLRGHARDLWDVLAPEMQRAGLLTPSTRLVLERYVKLMAKWRKAEAAVTGDFMRPGEDGSGPVKHPLCQLTVSWSTECRLLEKQLGLDRLEASSGAKGADPRRYLTQ